MNNQDKICILSKILYASETTVLIMDKNVPIKYKN